MTVYLINIALIIFWALVLLGKGVESSASRRRAYCIIVSVQWILLSGLRGLSVGPDTYAYFEDFQSVKLIRWDTIWYGFYDKYIQGASIKDPGYPLLVKTFQLFSGSYQVFLIFIAVLFTASMGVWIYRHSRDPYLSFLLYSCLFYSFFAITGIRQTIVTALVVFMGYGLIQRRRLVPFVALTLAASTIHMSALFFLPFYFVYGLKWTRRSVVVFVLAAVLVPLVLPRVLTPLAFLFNYGDYVSSHITVGGTSTYAVLISAVTILALYYRRKILAQAPEAEHSITAAALATVFTLATFVNQVFMRVQQYYALFLMLLIPQMISAFDKRERTVIYFWFTLVLVLLLVRTSPRYVFFWQ